MPKREEWCKVNHHRLIKKNSAIANEEKIGATVLEHSINSTKEVTTMPQ